MPKLSKRTLSAYIKSDCERRLALDLYNQAVEDKRSRIKFGMPERQPTRPGFELVARAGEEWQYEKVQDLLQAFGNDRVQWLPDPTPKDPSRIMQLPLGKALDASSKSRFLVESEFELTSTFKKHFNLDLLQDGPHKLKFSLLRPDLIFLCDGRQIGEEVLADGEIIARSKTDTRLGLRVIDIKLTSEPSAAYFAETVLYSMALAGWLVDTGRSSKYFVRPDASVWPGSYEFSPIIKASDAAKRAGRQASMDELLIALELEVEPTPVEVFVPRFAHILKSILPRILDACADWNSLPWEVTSRCRNCDYLGMKWGSGPPPAADLCIPRANSIDHLSRIAFVPRGAYRKLRENSVDQVVKVAHAAVEHLAFKAHPQLRATKGILRGRASSLLSGHSGVAAGAPSSSALPAWPQARIFIIAEFDPSSAISIAFAFNATWWETDENENKSQRRESGNLLVTDRSINTERDVFMTFLESIDAVLERIKKELGDPTLQVYLWDSVTFDHLTRLVGRHLDVLLARKAIRHLAWLFPPNELIANPQLIHRGSAIAIVGDAVRTSLAAPIPHVYSLLSVARSYHLSFVSNPEAIFFIDPFYEDPLTSQVPIERIHEFWHPTMRAKHLARMSTAWEKVLVVKLRALEHITTRLTGDLRAELIARAPAMSDIKPPTAKQGMAADAQLVYAFAEFNNALVAQENIRLRSLQSEEREATFASAKLDGLYHDRDEALEHFGLVSMPNRLVFTLSDNSTEIKAKKGDFSFALSDPNRLWFLERSLGSLVEQTKRSPDPRIVPKWAQENWARFPLSQVFNVTVAAIDRNRKIIVLDANEAWWPVLQWLESQGAISFSAPFMLDPVHKDYFLKKLEKTLKAIGICPLALPKTGGVGSPIGSHRGALKANKANNSPVAEVLWGAQELEQTPAIPRTIENFPKKIVDTLSLNDEQYAAVQHSFLFRFTLIWGPPGTGKTHTLSAAIIALFTGHAARGTALRVLVSAQTYGAIDEVIRKLESSLKVGEVLHGLSAARLRSLSATPPTFSNVTDITLKSEKSVVTSAARQLIADLDACESSILVFAPPQQVFLLSESASTTLDSTLFDVIILDEAGQLDFANAALALQCLAKNGSVIIAGDPLQLPPIRQADAPDAYTDLLGSLYQYFQRRLNVPDCKLSRSYRSNGGIIDAVRKAGYPSLTANSANLKSRYMDSSPPSDALSKVLAPDSPCCVLIYDDGEHAQANPIEVNLVGDVVERMRAGLLSGLENDLGRDGKPLPVVDTPLDDVVFWSKGVGIVTPHRAQQAMIITDLQSRFPSTDPALIRDAVDTVERFQGQQRDIMLVSFALGDTDAILTEEEFLLSLNRFNVMISRARAKVIVIVSRQVLDHLSDDIAILNQSRMLKWFCDRYCDSSTLLTLALKSKTLAVELRERKFLAAEVFAEDGCDLV